MNSHQRRKKRRRFGRMLKAAHELFKSVYGDMPLIASTPLFGPSDGPWQHPVPFR